MYENIDDIDFISLKIIEKNAMSKSKRQAMERKEELSRVLHRVENIYNEFEKPSQIYREFSSLNTVIFGEKPTGTDDSTNVECVKDVPTLEQLLVSNQSRQKYLQQVTVFIVGYSKIASDRLRLMQEVNQFFISSEDIFDSFIEREDKILNSSAETAITNSKDSIVVTDFAEEEDYTTSELANNVREAFDSCQQLTNRLGELNNEMIDCFVKYAQNKAGNKGKKKLDKALENAVSETTKIGEKLSQSLKVISEKDSRIDNLMKQIESKSKEVQKFKAAAESIKKAAMESERLKELVKEKETQILRLQSELAQSEMKFEQTKTLDAVQRANAEENAQEFQEKCKKLEKSLEDQKIEFEEIKRNMKRQHVAEQKQALADNEQSLQQIKMEHQQEMLQLKSSEFDENAIAIQWSEPEDDDIIGRQSSNSMSKNPIQESPSEKKQLPDTSVVNSRSGSARIESRQPTLLGSGRSSGKDVMAFSDAPELDNEEFWASIPRHHLLGRFGQYRQLSMANISNLLDEIELLQTTNTRQIYSLKSQHQSHKRKWDQEREMLIEAVRKTEGDRKEAQNYADMAMVEIEKFVSVMKGDEEEARDSNLEIFNSSDDYRLVERVDQIREYLKNHNLMNDTINRMIEDLMKISQSIQERSRISVPKFATMVDSHRSSKQRHHIKIDETQTENDSSVSVATIQDVALDENKDILFPEEVEENDGKRSVAISASPSLVKIAFYNDGKSITKESFDGEGVAPKDLESPSGMIDIEDRTGLNIIQHPVVTDYLHSYDHILTFKEQFLSILEELERAETSDILNLRSLNAVSIRSQNRIIPQIEDIGKSIEKILFISMQIIERLLSPKKKHDLKSNREQKSRILSPAKGKQLITTDKMRMSVQFSLLQEECREMKQFLKLVQQSYQSKFTVIDSSMNKLRQMISILAKQSNENVMYNGSVQSKAPNIQYAIALPNSNNSENKPPQAVPEYESVSILFTRKDSERNIGQMQQAMLENDFPEYLYEEAINKMSKYIEIPAKQLYILVRKYLHKDAMQKIADAVKETSNVNADTFKILNQMEDRIEKKQNRYSDIQEYLRNERIIRAKAMLDTFEKIEKNSTIFMIKPVITYKSRHFIQQLIEAKNLIHKTDELRKRFLIRTVAPKKLTSENPRKKDEKTVDEAASKFSQHWHPNSSVDLGDYEPQMLFESRLLEIDTNRMLLPLNNVSVPYSTMGLVGNEACLPPQIAVRSYVAIAHPTLVDIDYKSQDSNPSSRHQTVIEPTPKSRMSRDLSKHIPLPPITPAELNEKETLSTINQDSEIKLNKENRTETVY